MASSPHQDQDNRHNVDQPTLPHANNGPNANFGIMNRLLRFLQPAEDTSGNPRHSNLDASPQVQNNNAPLPCNENGFAHITYCDPNTKISTSGIRAVVPHDELFNVFEEVVWRLGSHVEVMLETSHDSSDSYKVIQVEPNDRRKSMQTLSQYRDLIINDPQTGVALRNTNGEEIHIRFDKTLQCFGSPLLEEFIKILGQKDIALRQDMDFTSRDKDTHTHPAASKHRRQFFNLVTELGAED